MALQFQGHRHLDDVIARLEKRYGKAGGKTPQPSEAHFKKNPTAKTATQSENTSTCQKTSVFSTAVRPGHRCITGDGDHA